MKAWGIQFIQQSFFFFTLTHLELLKNPTSSLYFHNILLIFIWSCVHAWPQKDKYWKKSKINVWLSAVLTWWLLRTAGWGRGRCDRNLFSQRKNKTDTDEDQFHVYVNPHMFLSLCACMLVQCVNVHTWVEKDWGRTIQRNENISVALWFFFFFNRLDFSVNVVVEGKQKTDWILSVVVAIFFFFTLTKICLIEKEV